MAIEYLKQCFGTFRQLELDQMAEVPKVFFSKPFTYGNVMAQKDRFDHLTHNGKSNLYNFYFENADC